MSEHRHDFWAEQGEVLLHKRDRDLWHVTDRYINVDEETDEWAGYYRLQDKSHTTHQHYSAEDIDSDFIKTGHVVDGKPVNAEEMSWWFE